MGGALRHCIRGPCYTFLDFLQSSRKGKEVIVIVGPSGVGKSTLIKRLMSEFAGRFGFSVSHTTRQPRPGEKHGVHYNFTSRDEIRDAIAHGDFIENAEVHGNIYGTSFEAVEKVVSNGRICVLDIDVQGAEQVKRSALAESAGFMFVSPPSLGALEERLRSRGTETEEKVQLRLKNARSEIGFSTEHPDFFDKVIVNNDLEVAYGQFREFMLRQCGRSKLLSEVDAASPGLSLRYLLTPRASWSPKD